MRLVVVNRTENFVSSCWRLSIVWKQLHTRAHTQEHHLRMISNKFSTVSITHRQLVTATYLTLQCGSEMEIRPSPATCKHITSSSVLRKVTWIIRKIKIIHIEICKQQQWKAAVEIWLFYFYSCRDLLKAFTSQRLPLPQVLSIAIKWKIVLWNIDHVTPGLNHTIEYDHSVFSSLMGQYGLQLWV